MKTPIFISQTAGTSLPGTSTRYGPLCGSTTGASGLSTAVANVETPMAAAGTFSKLYVRCPTTLTAGQSYTVTLVVNGTDTAVTCQITSAGTIASDTTHTAAVAKGDTVCIKVVPSGSPTAPAYIHFGLVFETTDGSSILPTGTGFLNVTANRYSPPNGNLADSVETATTCTMPCAGTITDLELLLSGAPGASASRLFTLRKNGVDTALSVTISGTSAKSGSATGSVHFNAGDTFTFVHSCTGTPANAFIKACANWVPDNAGDAIMFGVSSAPSTTTTRYLNTTGSTQATATTESDQAAVSPDSFNFTKAVFDIGAPGSGKSRAFTLRQNSAASAMSVTISNTATQGIDTDTVAVVTGDLLDIETVPTGTPTSGAGPRWGLLATYVTGGATAGNVSVYWF